VGYADSGQVGVYVGTREESLATSCEVIAAELRRIVDEPVPDEELRRTKEHLKGRLVLGLESPATRMNRVGRSVLGMQELLSLDEIIARIDAVTADDVQRLADEFWRPERMSAAAIGTSGDAIRSALGHLSPALVGA
jgi:predicted Zn-dependent peptidase